jgi:hypothetical protein
MAMDALFDDPRQQGLLALGLGLLNSRGTFGQGLGQAGQQAMGVMQQAREQQRLKGMQDIQQQLAQVQLEHARRDAERQTRLDALPAQFMRTGGKPEYMDNRDVGQPGEAPVPAQTLDLPGLTQAYMAAPGGLEMGLKLRQLTQKDDTPIALADGGKLVTRDGRVLAENAKDPKENEFVKAMRAAGIDPATPQGQGLLRNWLQKQSTHSPGVSVTYGAPVAGVDANNNPVFFQPDKTGGKPAIIPGVAPPPREVPAATREKLAQNSVTLSKIDRALGLVDQQPGSFGLQNVLPDAVTQRTDPSGVEARALVADIGGQKIHDRSGAAVSVGESARLKPYIPAATDDAGTVKKKLRLFRDEYAAMQQELNSGASIGQASAAKAAAAPAAGGKVRRFNPATGKLED